MRTQRPVASCLAAAAENSGATVCSARGAPSSTTKANGGNDYWFRQPTALVSVRCWKDLFPTIAESQFSPTNVNRWTLLGLIIAAILSIVFRSWWPIAIGAGIMLLALLISYGLQTYSRQKQRETTAKARVLPAATNNVGATPATAAAAAAACDALSATASTPLVPATTLCDDALYDDVAYDNRWSCPPTQRPVVLPPRQCVAPVEPDACCGSYPECGPGGLLPCGTAVDDPRATIPHPSGHNTYDQVDARYRRYAMKPQPVTVGNTLTPCATPPPPPMEVPVPVDDRNAEEDGAATQTPTPSSRSTTFGVDPRTMETSMNQTDVPASYRKPPMGGTGRAVDAIYSTRAHQPMTQTEKMLDKMYQDVNSYFWDTMVADRAPRWTVNPQDPRVRRKMEQDAIERESWRGFRWEQSA